MADATGGIPPDDSEDWVESSNPQDTLPRGYASEATQRVYTGDVSRRGIRAGEAYGNSRKVAFVLRSASGDLVRVFTFRINPQAITRSTSPRNALYATKGGFLVDNFGPGPTQITIRQLVAGGEFGTVGTLYGEVMTAREKVKEFMHAVYQPTVAPNGPKLYFIDNHLERGGASRGRINPTPFEERVFFASNGVVLQRSTDLHHVWMLELNLVSLQRYPFTEPGTKRTLPCNPNKGVVLKIRRSQSVDSLVLWCLRAKHGIARPSAAQKRSYKAKLLKLNPKLKKARYWTSVTSNPSQSSLNPGETFDPGLARYTRDTTKEGLTLLVPHDEIHVKAYRVVAGESVRRPCSP